MADVLVEADRALEADDVDLEDVARKMAAALAGSTTSLGAGLHAVLHAHARGMGRITVVVAEEELSPNEAAEILGVSRTLITKLLEDGALAHRTLPGSSYRRIPAAAVLQLEEDQRQVSERVDGILDALVEAEC